ncbi:TerD family protein [Desulfoscipio gibsoniae]|uniref:Putative stress response protein, TerZ-and CABP1 n=1 Tax=Desulfoscipio gibsoniae DSM 7213 TaxID=767817 RepID=R4KIY3_9FIRM|nr:TerD family protein [Desulfoscipio gibsoniae]AGL00490.1 putative stress response protein, TerZ- and CABP1 [Desulfoscipio gibsoniae DSM 7213]
MINLQKGQKIDLTKTNPGLTKIMVGLGWDPADNHGGGGKGLLGSLFGGGAKTSNIDCDASVFMLDAKGKLAKNKNLVYFGNKTSPCGSVRHSGDNLTGEGDGDDEQIMVDLSRVPADVHRLVFVVNIYDCEKRKQHFGMIRNAFIRVVNTSNNQELCKYNLSEGYENKTTLITGEVYRHQGEWKFAALGESTTDPGLQSLSRRFL